jgi:hypothetical protein
MPPLAVGQSSAHGGHSLGQASNGRFRSGIRFDRPNRPNIALSYPVSVRMILIRSDLRAALAGLWPKPHNFRRPPPSLYENVKYEIERRAACKAKAT